jgi:hypothetical protein
MLPTDEQAKVRAVEIVSRIIDANSLYSGFDKYRDHSGHKKVRSALEAFIADQLKADYNEEAVPLDPVLAGMVWGLEIAYVSDEFQKPESVTMCDLTDENGKLYCPTCGGSKFEVIQAHVGDDPDNDDAGYERVLMVKCVEDPTKCVEELPTDKHQWSEVKKES